MTSSKPLFPVKVDNPEEIGEQLLRGTIVPPSPPSGGSYQGIQFESRSPRKDNLPQNDKVLYHFDQSLSRLKQAGYQRHPSPREAFSFLADGLENKLTAEQKGIYDDMLQSYGEWLDMAGERQGDKLTLYSGIEGLAWNGNTYVQNNFRYAEKKEFDIAGKSSQAWIDLNQFDDSFIQYVYGRSFAQLPQEMREGDGRAQVYLPVDGILWPVGRGNYNNRFDINIDDYNNGASRGVGARALASAVAPQARKK